MNAGFRTNVAQTGHKNENACNSYKKVRLKCVYLCDAIPKGGCIIIYDTTPVE